MKANDGRSPAARAGASEQPANYSVAGEEDPGASPGCVSVESGQPKKEDARMLGKAVNRWENEGGSEAGEAEVQADAPADAGIPNQVRVKLTDAELVQLQLRVIALENLVTALLAHAPPETAELVRAVAANISPRPDSTQHHLTVRAAAQMIHLLERSEVSKTGFRK
jgi:hypothetical protein